MLKKCPKNFQMSEQYWGCLDIMSDVDFSPAETILFSTLPVYCCTPMPRPKIRPKNGFFCYVPFLGLKFWVTFCSNSNTLTFDSNSYNKRVKWL